MPPWVGLGGQGSPAASATGAFLPVLAFLMGPATCFIPAEAASCFLPAPEDVCSSVLDAFGVGDGHSAGGCAEPSLLGSPSGSGEEMHGEIHAWQLR